MHSHTCWITTLTPEPLRGILLTLGVCFNHVCICVHSPSGKSKGMSCPLSRRVIKRKIKHPDSIFFTDGIRRKTFVSQRKREYKIHRSLIYPTIQGPYPSHAQALSGCYPKPRWLMLKAGRHRLQFESRPQTLSESAMTLSSVLNVCLTATCQQLSVSPTAELSKLRVDFSVKPEVCWDSPRQQSAKAQRFNPIFKENLHQQSPMGWEHIQQSYSSKWNVCLHLVLCFE